MTNHFPHRRGVTFKTCPSQATSNTTSLAPVVSNLMIRQLVSLFHTHNGFVPGFEFQAEGFVISELVEQRLILPPQCHLDGNCYLVGEALEAAVKEYA